MLTSGIEYGGETDTHQMGQRVHRFSYLHQMRRFLMKTVIYSHRQNIWLCRTFPEYNGNPMIVHGVVELHTCTEGSVNNDGRTTV